MDFTTDHETFLLKVSERFVSVLFFILKPLLEFSTIFF